MLPMLAESVSINLINTMSTALLSNYSDSAAAASAAVGTIISMATMAFSLISVGATVIVSRFLGAGEDRKASAASWTAILMCTLLGAICGGGMLLFCDPLLGFLNLQGQTLAYAGIYFKIRCAFLPLNAILSILMAQMRCYGYPKYTFYACLIQSLSNYLLCLFVLRCPQYSPLDGVTGVAAANVVCQLIALLFLWVTFRRLRLHFTTPQSWDEARSYIRQMVKIGLPGAVTSGSYSLGQMVTTSFVAQLGDAALSAKVYYSSILCYTYLFSVNLGNANALLVGRLCGMKDFDRADRMTKQLVRLTSPVNLLISLVILAFRVPLLSAFTQNQQIIAWGAAVMLIDIIAEQSRAFSQIYEYGLRGAGDVNFAMVGTIISCWCCSIGLGYLFGIVCGWGIIGIWLACSLDEFMRAALTVWRWKTQKWRTLSIG